MSEDPLKDQIITAVKAVTGRVEAIDAVMKEIDEFDGSLGDKGTRCEIEAGMGFVVVDGHGRLVRVRLNPDSLETGDASKLGPRVLTRSGTWGARRDTPPSSILTPNRSSRSSGADRSHCPRASTASIWWQTFGPTRRTTWSADPRACSRRR
ncbi:hypothetical protein Airi02_028850 [Actinoallomurus iriomotensis]|uniref:Uncharacterized protein n=1 Tax=Actinoallomurus iriomotensis TaxID=478107 RepID=A0A9W6RY89_9ACTN|nr:hypothetical protein Airi02_028850 [Actinoallomurus iriomotensis]